MPGFITQTVTVSSQNYSRHITVFPPGGQGTWYAGYLQPSVLVLLSSGASMTYNIEVTGDDPSAPGWTNATGNWVPFTNFSALTASAVGTLGAMVGALRANVTSYSSGTLTFQFVQLSI